MKKIISCMLSAAMAFSSLGVSREANAGMVMMSYEFDDNASIDWASRGSAALTIDKKNYYDGNGSMYVSGRTESWHGALIELPSDKFQAGQTYSFSAAVLQKEETTAQIKMTLQYTSGGTEKYDEIALVSAVSSVWTDITNTDFTIPVGAERAALYFEMPDSLSDFYIDSFTAAEKGTKSQIATGAGIVEGKNDIVDGGEIRGDFNYDKVIDSMDMVIIRKYITRQFSGSTQVVDLKVADIDGDRTFAMNDAVLLQKYILGQITEFPEPEVVLTTTTTTTTKTTANPLTTTTVNGGGNYMEKIANDMQINAPASFTQNRAGVDYGTMEKKTYYSKDGQMNKNVNILLPPGYNTNEKYPVLFVLHGIFGDETSMPGMGIQTMLGNLIADGEAEKMIIVFPAMFTGSGSPGFTAESSRKYDLIREDIENSIMPFLEQNYSIKTGRENTAITGFSMGGREALYTGITRSDIYGYVGAACPAPGIFPTQDQYMVHEGCMSEGQFRPSTMPSMILISAAASDGVVGNYPQTYHEALEKNGVQHLWQIIPNGDHGGATVTPHMYNFLRYVFKAS